ncbi:GNAT family N-acetyltransferase [Streptomyces xanthophaeus]|uniref:GNAT family N-acetyltransferase n=1 Tax=Streptomyces xanthophaeus TaxID=67385 RepID=UPI0007C63E6A|nr:GNAT family N-acetyltransferase [Streptomyces xanthophaeus]
MSSDDVALRRASDADARSTADVRLRCFAAALPTVRCAHDEVEVHNWFTHVLLPQYETWVAATGSTVMGLLVLNGEKLKQLHLDPSWRGRGLGRPVHGLAKQQKPDGPMLCTFQVNEAALRFYERHGFIAPSGQTVSATMNASRTSATTRNQPPV